MSKTTKVKGVTRASATGKTGIEAAKAKAAPVIKEIEQRIAALDAGAAPAPEPNAQVAPTGGKPKKAPKGAAPAEAAAAANVANDVGSPGEPGGGKDAGDQLNEGKPHRQSPHEPKPSAGKNAKRNRDGARAPRIPRTPRTPKAPRKPGILGLAAEVLAKSKEPMTCAAIVEKVLAQKLWVTAGKTPAATLYAAIIRDIRAKGKDSRFVKTERGLFAAPGTNRKGA